LVPPSVRTPLPALAKPVVPAIGAVMTATDEFAPFVEVVMVGVPDEVARVNTLLPPPLSCQRLAPFASAKFKFPIVRDVSSVTVRLVVMSMVLKSAVESMASATVPFNQLVPSLQILLASLVHVPLAARESGAQAKSAAVITPASKLDQLR